VTGPADDDPTTLWVTTEAAADGTYIPSIEISDDQSVPLTRDTAIRHAMAVLTASQYAQYDAAVIRQLTDKLDMPLDMAAEAVVSLRADRPPLDEADTAPLVLSPGVSGTSREAFVGVWLGNRQVGQFDAESAAQHANYVLQVTIAADLDGAYHRWLRTAGIDDNRARAVVADLRDWRTSDGASS
jgi:hypothetical protein